MFDKLGSLEMSPDEFKKRSRIEMAWRGSIFFAAVFLFLAFFLGNEVNSIVSYLAAFGVSVIGMLFLYIKQNPGPVFLFFAISGSVICQLSCWYVPESIHYPDFIWITICCLIAFFINSKRTGIWILLLNLIGIGFFLFFKHNEHVETIISFTTRQLFGAYLEVVLAFSILGYLLYQFIAFQEIWEDAYRESNLELETRNIKIEEQNHQNVILLKEIHHRVKNNLQVIVSLLRLQKYELKTEEAKAQFQEAINRVLVMSSIHQRLYKQNDLINIDLKIHLEELVEELKSLFENKKHINIEINCSLKYVDLKTMVPVGLLINELLSNSLKYAFKNREDGLIQINVYEQEEGFNLEFIDNGEWIIDGSRNGFGLELIEVFTNQLNGTRNFRTDSKGTEYIFELHPEE